MFGWFKKKPAVEAVPSVDAVPAVEAAQAVVAAPAIEAPPVVVVVPPPSVATVVPAVAVVTEAPVAPVSAPSLAAVEGAAARAPFLPRRIGGNDKSSPIRFERPAPGEAAFEVQGGRQRQAEIVRIQAGGRRVLARLEDNGRVHAYTRRADGTFRLEHAPAPIGAILMPATF